METFIELKDISVDDMQHFLIAGGTIDERIRIAEDHSSKPRIQVGAEDKSHSERAFSDNTTFANWIIPQLKEGQFPTPLFVIWSPELSRDSQSDLLGLMGVKNARVAILIESAWDLHYQIRERIQCALLLPPFPDPVPELRLALGAQNMDLLSVSILADYHGVPQIHELLKRAAAKDNVGAFIKLHYTMLKVNAECRFELVRIE